MTSHWGGSNRCGTSFLVVLSLALISLPSEGFCFNSIPVGAPHDQITGEAASRLDWNQRSIQILLVEVKMSDLREVHYAPRVSPKTWLRFTGNDQYRPYHHFDRPPGSSHLTAFRHGVLFVRERLESAVHLAELGIIHSSLSTLGQGLHAVQDLYAHSNYVDLTPVQQALVDSALCGLPEVPLDFLALTGYDCQASNPEYPPQDPYSHGAYAKDSASKNHEAKAIVTGSRTKFATAFLAAVEASERYLREYQERISQRAPHYILK